MNYLKELWDSKFVVIDRRIVILALVVYALMKGYNYAYNQGATDMYGYIISELQKPTMPEVSNTY